MEINVDGHVFTYEKIIIILRSYIKRQIVTKRYHQSEKGKIATRRANRKCLQKKRDKIKQLEKTIQTLTQNKTSPPNI